jgi:hypothetical protein
MSGCGVAVGGLRAAAEGGRSRPHRQERLAVVPARRRRVVILDADRAEEAVTRRWPLGGAEPSVAVATYLPSAGTTSWAIRVSFVVVITRSGRCGSRPCWLPGRAGGVGDGGRRR